MKKNAAPFSPNPISSKYLTARSSKEELRNVWTTPTKQSFQKRQHSNFLTKKTLLAKYSNLKTFRTKLPPSWKTLRTTPTSPSRSCCQLLPRRKTLKSKVGIASGVMKIVTSH